MNRIKTSGYILQIGQPLAKDNSIRQHLNNKRHYLILKRGFDITFSVFVILFVLSWLFPLLAVLIKLTSRGPVLFIQKRVGLLGRSFNCFKFRTMIVNPEANQLQATPNDPRITSIGKFLRLSNLDELPQFFNVLIGNMSVVGPRPHMHLDCKNFAKVIPAYRLRTLVRPGITGLAQVKGCRGPAREFGPIFRRFQWDSFYVRNFSFSLDLRIIKLTIVSTLSEIGRRIKMFFKSAQYFPITLNAPRTQVTVKRSKREAYEMIANLFPVMNTEQQLPKVSAVIITYNEEKVIGKSLKQLSWCDEIIIVDSGSNDRTIQICREFDCDIHERSFNGFGEQKKFGVSLAKNDWILCIDADEVLSDPLIEEIKEELLKPTVLAAGFRMPRNLVFMDRIFKHGRESKDSVIRLFNRAKGNWDGAIVHEKVELLGTIREMKNKILHYSYYDYSQFIRKIDLYSSLGAQRLNVRNKKKSKTLMVFSLPFNFFKYYILDRNFLNGFHGFTWSAMNSFYHLLKYLKLGQLQMHGVELASVHDSSVALENQQAGATNISSPNAMRNRLKKVVA